MNCGGRGRRSNPAWCGFVLAALFLSAQLASWAHIALVPHASCAEHGELVHGHLDATLDAGEHDGAPSVVPQAPGGGGHEHCSLALAREPRVPHLHDAHAAFVLVPAPQADDCPEDDGGARTFPLYLLAPKQSPPRA
jgi:hypothetical protein